uniref:RRM domain-containing protein n=1 Tax=Pseudonaja textilis TaxID=8673 RepID=A0A670YFB2_PSETE
LSETFVNWADETDNLEDVSTTWHSNDDDVYRASPIDHSILPTTPQKAWEPNIDRSHLPKSPPYTAFLGNLPYDVTEESIKDFFRGLNLQISAVHFPQEPNNPERLKGFGYAEFEDFAAHPQLIIGQLPRMCRNAWHVWGVARPCTEMRDACGGVACACTEMHGMHMGVMHVCTGDMGEHALTYGCWCMRTFGMQGWKD